MSQKEKDVQSPLVIFVTTNKDPYNLHIPPMISIQTGLSYKSRYRKRWIDFEYKSKEQLIGRKGLYVLLLNNENNENFLPFRLFEIKDVFDYGDILFFEVIFKELIKFNDGNFVLYDELIKNKVYKGKRFSDSKKLVFDSNLFLNEFKFDDEKSIKTSRDIWTDIILKLGEYVPFKDIAFFKFNLFKNGKKSEEIKPEKISKRLIGYKLLPGKEYHFDFFEYAGGIKERESIPNPFQLSLGFDTNFITPIKPEEHIDGAYNRFPLIFQTKDVMLKEFSFININDNQKIKSVKMPSTYIPILIAKNPWLCAFSILLFIIGVFGFALPDFIKGLLRTSLPNSSIQALGLFLIVLSFSGGSIKRFSSLIWSKIGL